MPIEFSCYECGTKLRVGDDSAGKKAKCPKCDLVLDIPMSSETSPVAPSQAAPAAGAPTAHRSHNPNAWCLMPTRSSRRRGTPGGGDP